MGREPPLAPSSSLPDHLLQQIEQEEELRKRLESRERKYEETLMESILKDFGSRPQTATQTSAPAAAESPNRQQQHVYSSVLEQIEKEGLLSSVLIEDNDGAPNAQ